MNEIERIALYLILEASKRFKSIMLFGCLGSGVSILARKIAKIIINHKFPNIKKKFKHLKLTLDEKILLYYEYNKDYPLLMDQKGYMSIKYFIDSNIYNPSHYKVEHGSYLFTINHLDYYGHHYIKKKEKEDKEIYKHITKIHVFPLSLQERNLSNKEISILKLFSNKFKITNSNITKEELMYHTCLGGWIGSLYLKKEERGISI